MLQQAARQRTDSHNLHRIKYLRAIPILQDVAVNSSNVEGEHALESRRPDEFEPVESGVKGRSLRGPAPWRALMSSQQSIAVYRHSVSSGGLISNFQIGNWG